MLKRGINHDKNCYLQRLPFEFICILLPMTLNFNLNWIHNVVNMDYVWWIKCNALFTICNFYCLSLGCATRKSIHKFIVISKYKSLIKLYHLHHFLHLWVLYSTVFVSKVFGFASFCYIFCIFLLFNFCLIWP